MREQETKKLRYNRPVR